MDPNALQHRFARAASHPTYAQAMQADDSHLRATAGSSPLPMILLVGIVSPVLAAPVFIVPFLDEIPWMLFGIGGGALLVLVAAAAFVIRRVQRKRSNTPLQRVLCVVVSVNRTHATYNPLTLILQLPDGNRFQCDGLAPVAARMVAPGDIGVAFLTKSINGLTAVELVRIEV